VVTVKGRKTNCNINKKEAIKIVEEFKRIIQLVAISKDISQIVAFLQRRKYHLFNIALTSF